jgi:hypothetical protein
MYKKRFVARLSAIQLSNKIIRICLRRHIKWRWVCFKIGSSVSSHVGIFYKKIKPNKVGSPLLSCCSK